MKPLMCDRSGQTDGKYKMGASQLNVQLTWLCNSPYYLIPQELWSISVIHCTTGKLPIFRYRYFFLEKKKVQVPWERKGLKQIIRYRC